MIVGEGLKTCVPFSSSLTEVADFCHFEQGLLKSPCFDILENRTAPQCNLNTSCLLVGRDISIDPCIVSLHVQRVLNVVPCTVVFVVAQCLKSSIRHLE